MIFLTYKRNSCAAGLLLLVAAQLSPLEEPSECESIHISFKENRSPTKTSHGLVSSNTLLETLPDLKLKKSETKTVLFNDGGCC